MSASKVRTRLFVGLAVATVLLGCGRASSPGDASGDGTANAATPAGDKGAAATTSSMPTAARAAVVPRGPRVEQAAYIATLAARGVYTAEGPAEVVVAVVPKPPFHINAEYPHKFTVQIRDGVTPAKEVVTPNAAQVTLQRLEIPVSLTPVRAGVATVGGELKFSVCTDERCLLEKQELSLSIQVGPKP